jgi:malate dehydrogenase (oxaloacetate-decarboxylating)
MTGKKKDYDKLAIKLAKEKGGKLTVEPTVPLKNKDDLSLAYTPGVAAVSRAIAERRERAYDLTIKGNSVAVVSDGSAVLGLGKIGPEASLPVMEGKAALFKKFADIDAYPIVLDTWKPDQIIRTVKAIAPGFGGINLEDIRAPQCFEIEDRLQDLGIPVFHDDQHGTAIVVLAALINAAKVVGKSFMSLKVVIVGAGAAGTATARLLSCLGDYRTKCTAVREIKLLDRSGVLTAKSADFSEHQRALLEHINPQGRGGDLRSAIEGADVFIGVSGKNVLPPDYIKLMAPKPIVFAMANPDPEIDPDAAKAAGAAVIATGRSDYPNQVNNVLAFPGVFRGALDGRAERIDDEMKINAAIALSNTVKKPTAEKILPSPLDTKVAPTVAKAVKDSIPS